LWIGVSSGIGGEKEKVVINYGQSKLHVNPYGQSKLHVYRKLLEYVN